VLQGLGSPYSWRQDDLSSATVNEVISEIQKATDSAIFSGCMMIGQVIELSTADLPEWVLLCDGSTYDDEDYPELGAVIHENLRVSATSFRVPQREGRFALGGVNVGTQDGFETVTLTVDQMPSHSHTEIAAIPDALVLAPGEVPSVSVGTSTTTGLTGGGQSHSNMPPFEQTRFVIVARYPFAGG